MLNGLDLFSGIGGITEALAPWVRTIAYCENDRYATAVLLSRMERGEIDTAPIWDDVTTLKGSMLPRIDIIYGGFPCQDISVAGRGAGLAGQRSGLFYEIVRLCREIRPSFLFLENVPAIVFRGEREVLAYLSRLGFDGRRGITPAFLYGANFLGKRWWLAAADRKRFSERKNERSSRNGWPEREQQLKRFPASKIWYEKTASCLAGKNDGIPFRDNRNYALGNSVVPQQAREAFKRLMGLTAREGKE